MVNFNIGLSNSALYEGCEVKESGGRLVLVSPMSVARPLIVDNAIKLYSQIPAELKGSIIIGGPISAWVHVSLAIAAMRHFQVGYFSDGKEKEPMWIK